MSNTPQNFLWKKARQSRRLTTIQVPGYVVHSTPRYAELLECLTTEVLMEPTVDTIPGTSTTGYRTLWPRALTASQTWKPHRTFSIDRARLACHVPCVSYCSRMVLNPNVLLKSSKHATHHVRPPMKASTAVDNTVYKV